MNSTSRPPRDLVLATLRKLGAPSSADRILETIQIEHWRMPGSPDWTVRHVTDHLLALQAVGIIHRAGFTRTGPAARAQGRAAPLYALTDPTAPWYDRALATAAQRLGGELGATLLRLRDQLATAGAPKP